MKKLKERITHIADAQILNSKALCNPHYDMYNVFIISNEKVFDSVNKDKRWCKTCKNLFNANHSVKFKKLLK